MKKVTWLLLCLSGFAFCLCPPVVRAADNPGFDKVKTLVGDWEGKAPDGKPVRVSYRLVSSGTALMETLGPGGESEMVTIYTADADRVALTHYCNANNQPRMRSAPVGGIPQKLDFSFVGATNLASPTAGHMHNLTVTFEDKDHFTQMWTWREGLKERTTTFHFTRKPSS